MHFVLWYEPVRVREENVVVQMPVTSGGWTLSSQLLALFGKVQEVQPCLEDGCHWGGLLGKASPTSICSLCFVPVIAMRALGFLLLQASLLLTAVLLLCQDRLLSLHPQSGNTPFLKSLLAVMFYCSNSRVTDRATLPLWGRRQIKLGWSFS